MFLLFHFSWCLGWFGSTTQAAGLVFLLHSLWPSTDAWWIYPLGLNIHFLQPHGNLLQFYWCPSISQKWIFCLFVSANSSKRNRQMLKSKNTAFSCFLLFLHIGMSLTGFLNPLNLKTDLHLWFIFSSFLWFLGKECCC